MASQRMPATSRDPEGWAKATAKAREVRAVAAKEVAAVIATQVEELIVAGDVMGGRSMLVERIRKVAAAEQRGDQSALRAALMDGAVAFGQWIAALDYEPPPEAVTPRNRRDAAPA